MGIATFERNLVYADEVTLWTNVIENSPRNWRAYSNRGVLRAGAKDFGGALSDYDHAIAINPGLAEAFNNRASLLATAPLDRSRNGKQAVADARRACEMTNLQRPEMLDTLAAAYAENGEFQRAVHWQQEAIKLGAGNPIFLREAQERLKLYQAGRPYHERQ